MPMPLEQLIMINSMHADEGEYVIFTRLRVPKEDEPVNKKATLSVSACDREGNVHPVRLHAVTVGSMVKERINVPIKGNQAYHIPLESEKAIQINIQLEEPKGMNLMPDFTAEDDFAD